MAKRRRTEIAWIADPAARLVTYSKRRKGLFNKASELCRLCGARAAVVVFSPAGKPCSFGDPSADQIISDYLRGGGGGGDGGGEVMPTMGLTQWVEWVETEWDACATEEGLESLILKYEAVRDCAREKLKALEDDSRVMAGAGDSHELIDEEIDSIFESLKGQNQALAALLTEGDHFSTSPEDPAAGDGSLAAEPTPVPSDLGGYGFDPEEFLNLLEDFDVHGDGFLTSPENPAAGDGSLAVDPTPAPSDLGDHGFDPEELLNLWEDFDGHGDGFLTWPEDSAAGDGSLAVAPTPAPSDLGDHGFDPDDILNLLEDFDGHGDGFLTWPEDSAAGDGSLAVAPTPAPSDLGDHGFDPDDFLNLFEDFDGHGDGFLTSPEESAVGGGSSGVNGYDPNDFATLEELGVHL